MWKKGSNITQTHRRNHASYRGKFIFFGTSFRSNFAPKTTTRTTKHTIIETKDTKDNRRGNRAHVDSAGKILDQQENRCLKATQNA